MGGRWKGNCSPPPRDQAAITPTRCTDRTTRTRPQTHRGCSYQAPPAGQGLQSPGSGHRSERPPGWALRGPPVRVRLPLTSLGGGDRASPCAAVAALRPTRAAKSRPRSRATEVAARTPERAGRRPCLSEPREAVSGSRCCPLLLLFLSTSCSPLHSYFRQRGSLSQSSSPPSAGPPCLLSAAGDTLTRHPTPSWPPLPQPVPD